MTTLWAELHAGLATASVSSARGRWRGQDLLDAAERFAAWLGRQPAGPVISSVAEPALTAVTVLAGDLSGRPVIHTDPDGRATPPGILAMQTAFPAADYRDEGTGLYVRGGESDACLRGVPEGSQVFLTSGSTGTPAGVVRSAAAVLADARRVTKPLRYEPGRLTLVSAPVHHVYGFSYGLLAPLWAGAPAYYLGPRVIPSQLGRAARRLEADTLIGHQALYRMLADDAAREAPADLRPLRQAVSAGAPLAAGSVTALRARHHIEFFNCYGSSEAGAVTLSPVHGTEPAGDGGELLDGVEATTADGELLLRSSSLAAGYLAPDGLVPLHAAGAWYRTGDLAELDGYRIRLRGRVANVINIAGEKVSAEEIEAVLAGHPDVLDAEVHAEADPARGEVPVAVVTLRADRPIAELVAWCRARLEPYKVPRRIEVRGELPRTATGKRVRTPSQPGRP
jgi:acyl-coenzyme A synthetase/AMP-(fatty) acid ligase